MPRTEELYRTYQQKVQRIADVKNATAVLQWDQETYLPKRGAELRGQQITTLSEIAHGLFSEEELGALLNELTTKENLSPEQKRNVALTLEDYTKNKKYSAQFVRRLSGQTNKAFHSWIEARRQNSFAHFEADLHALIELKKEETNIVGYVHHPYDALLDEFEKGASVKLLDTTFEGLLPSLKELTDKIKNAPQVDNDFLHQTFSRQQQWEWGMYLVKELNFDFDAGRQDISEHPFSVSFNPADVRITTRIDEADFGNMTWSCIHETGHALYEQGLRPEEYGLPLGEACSYSIHESQSRLWENHVGRGEAFWKYYFPGLQQRFSTQFGRINGTEFYRGINKVEPSLIRTEADEINYHFHVYVRYQLEKGLIEGSIDSADIPSFWNQQYKELIDVTVPDDKNGCLQDVHWSHGSFGYFPTYSLGSFYAAQFYATAQKQLNGFGASIGNGDTGKLLQWLRSNIHSKGRYYSSEGLCKAVTGETLDISYFVKYLLEKYATIYNL